MPDRINLQPGQVTIRHVKLRQTTDPVSPDGAVTVLGKVYFPSRTGINGQRGFVSGNYERRINEAGTFTLRFPNAAGEDGVLHRNRFLILQKGRRLPVAVTATPTGMVQPGTFYSVSGGNYRPGDEWIEVYREQDLLYVGTPTQATITQADITITGEDCMWLQKKSRSTAADFWSHAPRDVIHNYLGAWTTIVGEDFGPSGPAIANNTDSVVQTSETIGGITYNRLDTVQTTLPGTGVARIGPVVASIHTSGRIRSVQGIPWGLGSSVTNRTQGWRVEASLYFGAFGDQIAVGFFDYPANSGGYVLIQSDTSCLLVSTGFATKTVKGPTVPGRHTLAVEGRGRWVYYYLDGALLGVLPMPTTNGTTGVAFVQLAYVNGLTSTLDVDSMLFRRTQPFLLRGTAGGEPTDPGDYRLPGAPPSGGLIGTYYNDADIATDSNRDFLRFNPTRSPYANRQDTQVNLTVAATATPPAYPLPQGIGATVPPVSVIWTGSIFLDLDVNDRFLRINHGGGTNGTAQTRIFIGKTRAGEEYNIYGSTGAQSFSGVGSMRGIFGNNAGWYPIRIESWYQGSATPGTVILDWATSSGGAGTATVPASNLSPLGIFNQQIRYESHYDAFQSALSTYSLQCKVVPQPLESGLFPGQIIPRIREGRNTEKTIDFIEATQIGVQINAEDVADSIFADAQGLADPTGNAQLTAEGQNFARIDVPGFPEIERHLTVASEYETLSEITFPALLLARLNSLLALRGSAWENAAAVPAGVREYLDQFPLAGAPAEFFWEPGDGVRLWLGEIGVEDASPRQILGVTRDFVPDGLKRPTVSFRQRPRDLATLLRAMQRDAVQQQRYYQQQFVVISGSLGGGGGVDAITRVNLPNDLTSVVNATLVVQYKSDASSWSYAVNGTTRGTLTAGGRYDVTPWVGIAATTTNMMYAQLTGGTGSAQYSLELIVRV